MGLLIVGGGPAGAAAAITARQAGVDVTLLEASRRPRIRPGEALHPGVEPILERLGAHTSVTSAGYLRHPGIWFQTDPGTNAVANATTTTDHQFMAFGADARGVWRGFQARRDDFDRRLLDVARSLGADVRDGMAARSVITNGARVTGVMTSKGRLTADHVIDASGSRRWLVRQCAIPIVRRSPPLVARYGYRRGASVVNADALPRVCTDADGWTWLADLGDNRFAWTRVTTPDRLPPEGWAPAELRHMEHDGGGRADVTWSIARHTSGDGWSLAGDAATILDPSSSHGVLRALMSGMLAAHAAIGTATTMNPTTNLPGRSHAYSAWLNDWFEHDASRMADRYRSAHLFTKGDWP